MLKSAVKRAKEMTKKTSEVIFLIGDKYIAQHIFKIVVSPNRPDSQSTSELDILAIRHGKDYQEYSISNIKALNLSFCHLNFCVLLPKKDFKEINFFEYPDGNYVKIGFEANKEDKTKGILNFSYKVKTKFKRYNCISIHL